MKKNFLTTDEAKRYLKQPNIDSVFLQTLLDNLDDEIEQSCNRKILADDIVDERHANNFNWLHHGVLKPFVTPILSIQSVKVWSGQSYETFVADIDESKTPFTFLSHEIIFIRPTFASSFGSSYHPILISYRGGFDPPPPALKSIAQRLLMVRYQESAIGEGRAGKGSTTVSAGSASGSESYTDLMNALDKATKPFKKYTS